MEIELPVLISLMAFAVSVASLTISILGYLRDRGRLRAWSTIIWQYKGPEPETPLMQIRIANTGRRPILVLSLVKRAGRAKWWRPIQNPAFNGTVIDSPERIEEVRDGALAHRAAVKLAEGEIIEFILRPEDGPEFFATHEDPPVQARYLQVEDVTGRLYTIKNSKKNIPILLKAWNP